RNAPPRSPDSSTAFTRPLTFSNTKPAGRTSRSTRTYSWKSLPVSLRSPSRLPATEKVTHGGPPASSATSPGASRALARTSTIEPASDGEAHGVDVRLRGAREARGGRHVSGAACRSRRTSPDLRQPDRTREADREHRSLATRSVCAWGEDDRADRRDREAH